MSVDFQVLVVHCLFHCQPLPEGRAHPATRALAISSEEIPSALLLTIFLYLIAILYKIGGSL